MNETEHTTEREAFDVEVFMEYGISYRGKPPRKWSWTPEYDVAMRDCARREGIHGETMGPIEVVQRVTTMSSTAWEPAVRPSDELAALMDISAPITEHLQGIRDAK